MPENNSWSADEFFVDFSGTQTSSIEFPTFSPLEFHQGIHVTINEPRARRHPETGRLVYSVVEPMSGHYSPDINDVYYSRSMSSFFRLVEVVYEGDEIWHRIEWCEHPDEDYRAEHEIYADWEFNEPFEYEDGRWYVVMQPRNGYLGGSYERGNVWYSELNEEEFRLGAHVRDSFFGQENTFRITWVGNGARDDGYSVEITDESVTDISPAMFTNIGRRIPLVSFEQEFSGNGDRVATELYNLGIGNSRYSEGYHMAEGRRDRDSDRFCFVETDSSCGYELIFQKVDLSDRDMADKISEAQRIMKKLRDEEQIRLSAACGFHVHVDVSNWGMREIVSAYHLWNYLEDTIFRFASAFWNLHREEEVGGGYSRAVPKGYEGRAQIGRALSERRDALNFSHILRERSNCGCGAGWYEDWENCTCNLAQPTLEFRVFNATINQRKIRAYLAFCVAFVNAVKDTEFTPVDYPEMLWRGTKRTEGEDWFDMSTERVKFILEKLPLTNDERSDIEYCFRNSSLSSVIEFI